MKEKRTIIIICIAALFIILCGACAFIGYSVMGGEINTGGAVKDSDSISLSTVALSGGAVPDMYTDSMRKTEVGNLDSRVSLADTLRNNTDSSQDKLKVKTDKDGIKRYTLSGDVVRIDVTTGINRFSYNRSYYFNNGYLYLADIYTGVTHSRLYYSDGIMYRYIKEDGSIENNNFGDASYCFIGNFALNEAKKFIGD